jgi:rod shape-determining protein MreC
MAIETTLFSKTSNGGYSLLFAAIAAIALMLADTHYKPWVAPLRYELNRVLSPVYTVVGWPGRLADFVGGMFRPASELRDENEYLRSQLLVLSVRVQKFSELAAENARLRGLIDSTLIMDGRVLIAEIIGVDPDPYRHIVMLNKGQDSGIYVGQPIFDAHGLMGQVIEVGPGNSRALLVTDRLHAVPVRINRTGTRAVLAGTGSFDQMQLLYVPDSADVKVGDLLISSGLGQRFPPGYPVAVVTAVKHSGGADFAQIAAKPTAEVDRSRQVLLMFSRTVAAAAPKPAATTGGTHGLAP